MKKDLPAIPPDAGPADLFLISETGRYSYGDLFSFGTFFQNQLRDVAITANSPLAICAASCDELIFIIASCWIHGIPFVPVDSEGNDALTRQLSELNPSLIIPDINEQSSPGSFPQIPINEFNLSKVLKNTMEAEFHSDHSPKHIFGYFFTSGTSDRPKIVPLKRRQMHIAAKASAGNFKPKANEAWLLCMPLNHIGGISVILRSLIYGSAIYRYDDFDQRMVSSLLATDNRVVAASLVPTMLKRLLDDREFRTHPNFKAILLGGGPIAPDLLNNCIDQNIPIVPSYGMTETCAQIAANPLQSTAPKNKILKSVGKLFSPNKIEIRDENKTPITKGKSGTIWLKGPQVFDGYLGSKISESFDGDGWFNTRDFGHLDEQNRLYIEARRTDLIITGGENVSPVEVETVLLQLSFIKEAAVFGVPDEEWGQLIVAVIVPGKDEKPTSSALKEALKGKLKGYKIPKQFIITSALPKTQTGKIKRSELKKYVQE